MTETITTENILYYPTIEFQDVTWLKSALCVWEHVYRIVPAGYKPRDPDEVRMAVDAGLVRDISLTSEDLSSTADLFLRFWEKVPVEPAGFDSEVVEMRLSPHKVDARIRPVLEKMAKSIDPDGWLHLPEQLANGYMLFLSEMVSRRRCMPKLTDSCDMFAIMHYFANDGNFNELVYNEEATEVTTAMVLTTVLPGGLDKRPMDEVLRFRPEFAHGRKAFRDTVTQCAKEFSAISDKSHAVDMALDLRRRLSQAKEGLAASIKRIAKDLQYAALAVGVPATLTAITVLAGEGEPFQLRDWVGAGVVGAVAALADARRSRRATWEALDAGYYLQLRDVFASNQGVQFSVPNFHRIFEEFIND